MSDIKWRRTLFDAQIVVILRPVQSREITNTMSDYPRPGVVSVETEALGEALSQRTLPRMIVTGIGGIEMTEAAEALGYGSHPCYPVGFVHVAVQCQLDAAGRDI